MQADIQLIRQIWKYALSTSQDRSIKRCRRLSDAESDPESSSSRGGQQCPYILGIEIITKL